MYPKKNASNLSKILKNVLEGPAPLNRTVHRGLCPHTLGAFGLNLPSQVVIGYHWLEFLNQIRRNFHFPET